MCSLALGQSFEVLRDQDKEAVEQRWGGRDTSRNIELEFSFAALENLHKARSREYQGEPKHLTRDQAEDFLNWD